MSPLEASCPSCGAPISFKSGSSIVVVCDFCQSVVARTDRKLEDLGKVAEVVESGSPLDVGLRGVYQGVPFELTGRAQLGHEAGGLWDEWYAAFADGQWGWLAEAQGRYYLTFRVKLSEQRLFPPFDFLELGQPVPAIPSQVPLVVAEKGVARALGAKGEIPYRLVPGAEYEYADLSGIRGEFATIDYSQESPLVFMGREVSLDDLGIPKTALAPEREARRVSALQLSCPKCGGPLSLRAPDVTERVTCPNCGSLLDVAQGRLQFLQALKPAKVEPVIPLGAVGEFDGGRLTVIGFMQRSVEFEGVRYYWEEYLLYEPRTGFRWLVRSDDNWNFVQSVAPGEVISKGRKVQFRGQTFKLYQDTNARVEHVQGEFYWKVTAGEMVRAADYVHPPLMLSKEVTLTDRSQAKSARKKVQPAQSGEINWSLGTYLKPSEVEKTFAITGLPRPTKIAPNQMFPHKAIYKYWLLLCALAFVFGAGIIATGSHRKVFERNYALEPMTSADTPQVMFSEQFDLKGGQNIKVMARSPVDNTWLYVEGDLVNEETGLVQAFSIPVEYYHGVDGGESWSEGSKNPAEHISALPEGKYTLRLEVSWERWQQPASLSIRVEQDAPRVLHVFLALVALSIIPLIVAIRHFSFEKRRWEDSDYSPFSSS